MLNILFLSHRLPFPPDRGDRIRSYHMIRYLAQRHRVSLAAVVDRAPDSTHLRALREFCESVDVGYVNPRSRQIMAACYLATTVPLTLPLFFSRALKARILRRLHSETFDLIFIYCSAMAPYVLSCTGAPKVVDFIDADSQKWFDYARSAASPMKGIYWREGVLLRRYERRVAEACAHAFATSEREAEILRQIAPRVRLTVIPSGVTVQAADRRVAETHKLVFTGVMEYRPNVDAMTYFVRDIFPIVRERVPQAELVIVGQNPSRQVRRLAGLPGITVTGWVADVSTHLESAAVFVAPLRIARGVQNKILEAMAAGVPVVCTTPGLAGIGAVPGRDLWVGDTPELFAAHTVSLLLDRKRREELGRSAAQFVRQHHEWDAQLERLERVLVDVARRYPNHAVASFR